MTLPLPTTSDMRPYAVRHLKKWPIDWERLKADLLSIIHLSAMRGMGIKFPSPVVTIYDGKPTEDATRMASAMDWFALDREFGEEGGPTAHDLEVPIYKALKDLHSEGKIKFLLRWGETYCVPAGYDDPRPGDRWLDLPAGWDKPHYWEDL